MYFAAFVLWQWLMHCGLIRQPLSSLARTALLALGLLAPCVSFALVDCSVTASPLTFGLFDPDGPNHDTDSGQVTVTCTVLAGPAPGSVAYTISMSAGTSGSYSPRRLQNGAYTLSYNLFTSGARSAGSVWGDGSAGTVTLGGAVNSLNVVGARGSVDHIVYGRIPGPQSPVAIGTYIDAISITLNF
jgi:spore coat protein U-like protein